MLQRLEVSFKFPSVSYRCIELKSINFEQSSLYLENSKKPRGLYFKTFHHSQVQNLKGYQNLELSGQSNS